jgi:acyl carrier protein
MTEREALALAHPEQLVLWIWESEQVRQERVSGVDTLVTRLESVPVARLAEEFEVYQHQEHLAQTSLADLLEALCQVLRGSPAAPAQVLAPLVVWHETRDSRVVDEALDELHWMDPDAFWFLLQSFLNHPDQRLIDMASRAGERAERTGESGSDRRRDILDGLAEIINEVAGVAMEEVRMGARFKEDLDLDSLSIVEVVVAAEERFDISIPDRDIMTVQTVREAVDYIVNAPSRPPR